MNHSTRNCIHLLIVAAFMMIVAANPVLTFAMPRDPIDPDPVGGDEPDTYTAPDNGFDWRVPARFGLYENGIVDFNWIEDQAIYEPAYVNPTDFPVIFDGCRTETDEENGRSDQLTYTWTIDGQVTSGPACRIQHIFHAQRTYVATLRITQADGSVLLDDQGRGNPFTQSIVVKDLLIVSIGDSFASGEGNPDVPQRLGGSDIFGQPTHVESPPVWQDRRCHRSASAAPARAARMLEAADPHTSVTFLSFACSGATIDTHTYKDASVIDPYRSPYAEGWIQDQGTGILGPASGQEPPDPNRPQDNWLPSQISQTLTALTNYGQLPARPVDALIVSGGGNDIAFGTILTLCSVFYVCDQYEVERWDGAGLTSLRSRVAHDIGTLPGLYADLAQEIQDHIPFTENGRVYITQYPDLTRNAQGGFCDEMLQDVIPWWMQPILFLAWVADAGTQVPLPPYRMDHDETSWAGGVVAPALNRAVAAAAEAHSWILVDGINDSTANLFATHGYCAPDNWIRTATEAVNMQGPWVPWNATLLPPASAQTIGTMHPTERGLLAIAERIVAKIRPNLLPLPPGQEPPAPPTFSNSSDNAIVSASGWLTGHEAGVACPGAAANCTFAQVVATSAANTLINGASLFNNGAPVACSAAGVTVGGLTCQAQLTTPQTYNWSLAFASDGIYQLEFRASSNNGANSTFNREVKVDLTDPTVSHKVSSPLDASGWYRIPVTVTVTAADGAGSGPATIEYQLDGYPFVFGGNSGIIDVYDNGLHALTYRTTDTAGRMSAWQTLGLRIDQTAPVSTVSVSPAANNNGWHSGASVEVTLSATDSGGSGLAGLTYSAAGAQPIASTTVDDDDTVSLSITAEGETTISFFAADFAGNVELAKTVTARLDRTAPVSTATVSPAASNNGWHSASSVGVTLSATDSGGSGLAGFTYSATGAQPIASTAVDGANPVQLSIETEGVTTISFAATDVAGNIEETQTISVRLDKGAPVVTCAAADRQWHASDVSLACTASDSGSGLAETSPASFNLSTSVAQGTEDDNASTGSQTVCDAVGNCVTVGPLGGNMVDKKGPTITISAPASQSYLLNESISAGYGCADGGSGVATCVGPVVGGNPVDTASPGAKSFTVSATDRVGNTASQSVSYNVAYGVCVLFDQTRSYKLGSTIPIKLQLCDAGGSNMSAAGIVLNATGLTKKDNTASGAVEDAGNSNPDSNFRFDAGLAGYIFNLSTKGLSTGTWALSFRATNDPIPQSVEFDVR